MRRIVSLACLLLAACGTGENPARLPERDPAVEQALADRIMSDPDLASQNEGNAALTVISDHSLPLPAFAEGAADDARVEAAEIVGGADKLLPPPAAGPLQSSERMEGATLAEFAASLPGGSACTTGLTSSAIWAARLPAPWTAYPGSATTEAIGSDATGCHLRVVRFVTPASADDVLSFYAALARQAGVGARHSADSGAHVLAGASGPAAFRLTLEPADAGLTQGILALRQD
jgi:hypothetical protein